MSVSVASNATAPREIHQEGGGEQEHQHAHLLHAIERAAHLLPSQGPITVFVHHNTLHAFEDLPFDEAIEKAGKIFGCQSYLSEERYREELGRGRIRLADLKAILREELGAGADERIPGGETRLGLLLAMLQYPLRYGPTEELLWFVAETDALRRVRRDTSAATRGRLIAETRHWVMRDLRGRYEVGRNGNGLSHTANGRAAYSALVESFGAARIEEWREETWESCTLHLLWRVCRDGVATVEGDAPRQTPAVRHRDLLLRAAGQDIDLLVHQVLIPFCGAFMDQGLAHWQLPHRDEGFYRAFQSLYLEPGGAADGWRRSLGRELQRLRQEGIGPLDSIRESLDLLGVPEEEWEGFLSATLLTLRGWAGIIHFLEERPDRGVHPVPPGSLAGFLAVRLVLERLALAHTAREALGYTGPLRSLRDELRKRLDLPAPHSVEQRAFSVFQLAQVLGWTPEELHRLSKEEWAALVREIEAFTPARRRRVFHHAYERRFYTQFLDALAVHNRTPRREPQVPRFQAMFCIDDREESIRRHIEEVAPDAVTFGIAGFYFVAMYYRGAADAHFLPLCPIVIQPRHRVVERVVEGKQEVHARRSRARRALGRTSHRLHAGSRTLAAGAFLSAALGVLASVPLVVRTFFPRLTARIRKAFGRLMLEPPPTRLQLERTESAEAEDGCYYGYTLEELTDIAERVLRDTGLTSGFARLVLTFGHGSSSLNNPHESAYNCGACGGARGGPNGRAIAQILNDPRVRERLRGRGLDVPDDTVFVGGMHNTCSEALTFYDLDLLPESHRQEFEAVRSLLEEACDRDAHERCRRFESAPLTLSFAEARRHVEGRAEDLAQVWPEWGHATNAVTVVGRRSRTRGLFLDRRVFLNSYDPSQDDAEATILTRILQAAVPVCAGIGLEYYFSEVDSVGYGCSTKLPHNVAALLGVMDGAASDLRTGLPWQMVEFHEPVRQLFVIETAPETMLRIMDRNPNIGRLVRNGWVILATLDPDSPDIHVYRNGAFEKYRPTADQLPKAASSVDWYRGWRDHLEFAQIGE